MMSLRQMGSQITMLQKLRENYEKKTESERATLENLKLQIEETKNQIEEQRLILHKNQEVKVLSKTDIPAITNGNDLGSSQNLQNNKRKIKIYSSVT